MKPPIVTLFLFLILFQFPIINLNMEYNFKTFISTFNMTFPFEANYPTFTYSTATGYLSQNWNIFGPSSGANQPVYYLVLEPLAIGDVMTGNKLLPWLATNWTFVNGTHDLVVYLRHNVYFYYKGSWTILMYLNPQIYMNQKEFNVTWLNGTTIQILWLFTAKDVIATFQDYFKVYGNPYGISVKELNLYEVQFYFKYPNVQYALYTILTQLIVPWEEYANLSDPSSANIQVLIGTGPYYLSYFSPGKVILDRNPYYWIPGRPLLEKVIFYVAPNQQEGYEMLSKGQVQWGGFDAIGPIPPSQLFTSKNPRYYHEILSVVNGTPAGEPTFLFINYNRLNYWPWNESWFRLAISLAINRTQVSLAATGTPLGEPPTPATFLPFPMEMEWLNSTTIQEASLVDQFNPSEALMILEKHGFYIADGFLHFPNGSLFPPVTILGYSGFPDNYYAELTIASDLQKFLGLSVSLESTNNAAQRAIDIITGNYDLVLIPIGLYSPAIIWGSAFIPPLIPETDEPNITAIKSNTPLLTDWGRWIPPKEFIDLYLKALNITNSSELKEIYNKMAMILIKEIPAIPAVEIDFPRYQYEDNLYIGFPTQEFFYTWNVEPYYEPLLLVLNLAPRPAGMPNSQELNYTKHAWEDLLNYIYGKSNTATPQSLLQILYKNYAKFSIGGDVLYYLIITIGGVVTMVIYIIRLMNNRKRRVPYRNKGRHNNKLKKFKN